MARDGNLVPQTGTDGILLPTGQKTPALAALRSTRDVPRFRVPEVNHPSIGEHEEDSGRRVGDAGHGPRLSPDLLAGVGLTGTEQFHGAGQISRREPGSVLVVVHLSVPDRKVPAIRGK